MTVAEPVNASFAFSHPAMFRSRALAFGFKVNSSTALDVSFREKKPGSIPYKAHPPTPSATQSAYSEPSAESSPPRYFVSFLGMITVFHSK